MAVSGTYYLNAPSLASATAVFDDALLTILSEDGYYSEGSIVRQQVGGVLLPQQICPSCESFNCVEGTCVDPGDGTGEYATLEECQAACGVPMVSLGAPICRENNCNDNAICAVRYGINTNNAPVGSYITVVDNPPTSTASVTVTDSTPPVGELRYYEPNGLSTAVYFTLQLRNSVGDIIATSNASLSHQSFWPLLPLCPL